MTGRAGQGMLQTYDSHDNVPSVAVSDAGPSQPDVQETSGHVSPDPARLYHAIFEFSSNIKMPMENPPGKLASAALVFVYADSVLFALRDSLRTARQTSFQRRDRFLFKRRGLNQNCAALTYWLRWHLGQIDASSPRKGNSLTTASHSAYQRGITMKKIRVWVCGCIWM